jgi:serine/threonine-protein kinase
LLVQEYIDGRTITGEVKERGPIPWPEALRWTVDVLRALAYAHRLKIIHRDIKPSNIILYAKADGQGAKLLDLGLAKCLDPTAFTQLTMKDAVTVGDALLGTFEYMAPEQWRGAEEIVPASDIYSLGCTLYYALSGGRPPFLADSLIAFCNAHTNTPPPRLTTALPDLPESIDALVQQMLSKDPAQRGTPDRLIKQCLHLLRSSSAAPPARSAESASPPSVPSKAATPAFTPAPKRPLDLPRVERGEPAPLDDRFPPFSSDSAGNIAGIRTFVRAFLVPGGLFRCSLVLILLALAVVGVLAIWLRN